MKFSRCFIVLIVFLLIIPWNAMTQSTSDSVIDGVVAVVGANIILKSDIESQYFQIRSQGIIQGTASGMKCKIIEDMIIQKLILHQSTVDSVTVTDAQVESEMDRRMRYFIAQAGSPERLEEHFQKTLVEIKAELRDMVREQLLVKMENDNIIKDVSITPSEVKSFFKKLPKDSIPEINSEMEIGIIVKIPAIGEEEKQEVKNKLKSFKDRIAKGDDFSTLAVMYSEDPGSSKQGGELGMFKRGEMRPEFEAAAFKLKPSEVSDIVETEDGLHLIQMIERRGEYVNVRHILLQPQVSLFNLNKAKQSLDSIADLIDSKQITFEQAVLKYSDDPGKINGGLMINAMVGGTRFEAGQLDPKVAFIIDKLKVGEISAPVLTKTDRGKQEYRLYYLKLRTKPHKANLDEDYARMQQLALEKKQTQVMDDWIAKKAESSYINIMNEYRNCPFKRKWIKN